VQGIQERVRENRTYVIESNKKKYAQTANQNAKKWVKNTATVVYEKTSKT
jgi:hypothetical protein